MSGSVTILLVGIIIIAAILVVVVALTRQGGKVLNVEKYQARWLAIENSLDKSNIGTYQLAIFEADKLLDLALRERGFAGDIGKHPLQLLAARDCLAGISCV